VLRTGAKLNGISRLNLSLEPTRQFAFLGAALNRTVNKRKPVNRMFEPDLPGGHAPISKTWLDRPDQGRQLHSVGNAHVLGYDNSHAHRLHLGYP